MQTLDAQLQDKHTVRRAAELIIQELTLFSYLEVAHWSCVSKMQAFFCLPAQRLLHTMHHLTLQSNSCATYLGTLRRGQHGR